MLLTHVTCFALPSSHFLLDLQNVCSNGPNVSEEIMTIIIVITLPLYLDV